MTEEAVTQETQEDTPVLVVKDGEEYLGIGALAKRYERSRQAVHSWVKRYGPGKGAANPMPEPAVTIRQDNGYANYGWAIDQLPALDRWAEENTRAKVPKT